MTTQIIPPGRSVVARGTRSRRKNREVPEGHGPVSSDEVHHARRHGAGGKSSAALR